jgi:glycosyltransferase involved in cell wall biosynthesis
MLSVLIPVYKWDPTGLVHEIREQLLQESISFEILVSDDTPIDKIPEYQVYLKDLTHVKCFHRNEPLSRSANRNFLASQAQFDYLLFVDCDGQVVDNQYIRKYLQNLAPSTVVVGGTCYKEIPPENGSLYLRWKFGKQREEIPSEIRNRDPWKSFSTFNFLIPSTVFDSIRFDESIREYGHEDTLFGIRLKEKDITVVHIDNPLEHLGLEEARVFLEKVETSVYNLKKISMNPALQDQLSQLVKLLRTYHRLKRFGLLPLFRVFFTIMKKGIVSNLLDDNPRMYLLDIYKLGVISQIA